MLRDGQVSSEQLILVDEDDTEIGVASREECHRGAGLRHRAFVLLIEDDRQQVLLQRRCGGKLGGDRWDVSATSHVRIGETYETGIRRCVLHELGIVQPIGWQRVLSFVYTERLGACSENEFCTLFTGRYDGLLYPNDAELSGLRWVRLDELITDIRADPVSYTSWLIEAATRFANLKADGATVRR